MPQRAARQHRHNHRKTSLRIMVLLWSLWLLGSWFATRAIDAAPADIRWASASIPHIQWMVLSAAFAMICLWPVLRLSQSVLVHATPHEEDPEHHAAPPWRPHFGAVLMEWFCLNLVLQAVLWPLRASAEWSVDQATWIMCLLAAWSLLIAAAIAWGRGYRSRGPRTAAAAVCCGLFILEPIAILLLKIPGWHNMHLSPLQAIWELTRPAADQSPADWSPYIVATAVAALLAWIALVVARNSARRSTPPASV